MKSSEVARNENKAPNQRANYQDAGRKCVAIPQAATQEGYGAQSRSGKGSAGGTIQTAGAAQR